MSHRLTLNRIEPVTHDTHHLVFDRPEGFEFTPGQAVDLALDREGWREEARPFTFVSLPGEAGLEFVIKSYPEHDGVTEQISRMTPGDAVLIDEPWGAIRDEGAGTFIAGGAGVTPFVAVLRQRLQKEGTLEGCRLIFSNATEQDIILRDTFEGMTGLQTEFIVTDQPDPGPGVMAGRIDRGFLKDRVGQESGRFYVCGPEPMIEDVTGALKDLGVDDDRIVIEDLD